MIKILLEGNEAIEYVDVKAELNKLRAINVKLTIDAAKITSMKPAPIKLSELTDLMTALSTGNYINSVKAIRSITGETLAASKNYIEAFFNKENKKPIVLVDLNEDEPTKTEFSLEECKHEDYYLPEDNVYICRTCTKEFDPIKVEGATKLAS